MKRFFKRPIVRFSLLAVVTLATVTALAGFARGWHHSCRDANPEQMAAFATKRVDRMLDKLDATDAQRVTIQGIKDDFLAKALPMKAQAQDFHAGVFELLQQDTPDAATLHSRIDLQLDALRTLAHDAADAALEVHDTLTPDQRAQLAELVERRHGDFLKRSGDLD